MSFEALRWNAFLSFVRNLKYVVPSYQIFQPDYLTPYQPAASASLRSVARA